MIRRMTKNEGKEKCPECGAKPGEFHIKCSRNPTVKTGSSK